MSEPARKTERPFPHRHEPDPDNPWVEYEREKAIIAATSETRAEYDRRIRDLVDRLEL